LKISNYEFIYVISLNIKIFMINRNNEIPYFKNLFFTLGNLRESFIRVKSKYFDYIFYYFTIIFKFFKESFRWELIKIKISSILLDLGKAFLIISK